MASRDGRSLKNYLLGLTLLGLGDLALGKSCVSIPDASPNPIVAVCATNELYVFRVGDRTRSFPRETFVRKLTQAATDWFSLHDLPTDLLHGAEAQIWMTVPEVNPEAAQPRFIVSTDAGTISFWFDLWTDDWAFSDKETAVFGSRNYPDSFGFRPQTVLIQAQQGVSSEQVRTALLNCGANQVVDQGGGWFHASANVFGETTLAANAQKSESTMIKTAQVNSVMEWIAHRKMALAFMLDADSEDNSP